MTLLAELPESQASGEIAKIYAEMKHLGAVPMVALIFRHIATLPGALDWAWNALGPAWRQGRLQEAGWQVAATAPLQPIATMPREVLAALGVDDAGLREVRIVVAAYNAANPENMLSILCLLRLLDGAQASAPFAPREWIPPAAPGPLVAMTDVSTMSAEVSALLDLVAAANPGGGPRVVQSLYRHFGHRPAFLALVVTLLRQRFDDGTLDRSVDAVRAAMKATADEIVRGLSAPPAPVGLRAVCEHFSGAVIPQMIVVGRLLDRSLPR